MVDKARMEELFGSDSEDDDAPSASEVPAPVDAGDAHADDDEDVGDLFGSDDNDDDSLLGDGGGAADFQEQQEPSAEPVDFALPRQPRPAADAKLYLVRLPNILKIQPRPFDPETYQEDEDGGDDADGGDGGGSAASRAANVIRWREGPTGGRESNARIVKWSDGSVTLHVGNEALKCQNIAMPEGSTHLYAMHKASNLECHGILRHKLGLAPVDRKSATHQAISKDIARAHTKAKSRMQLISTTEDPEAKKRQDERTWEDSKRLQARQAARRQRNDGLADDQMLTADFLDADDDGALEGNLGALKRGFKARRKRGFAEPPRRRGVGRSSAVGGKRARRGGSDDEDDDSYDGNDDDDEEDDEGEPGEMDGFIVGEGEDESDEDDEDEAEMTDDDDGGDDDESEDERPAKASKGKLKKKVSRNVLVDDDED